MNNLSTKFLLNPDITFLNHGSFGATPKIVFEKYQALQLELERQPVEFLARDLEGRMHRARQSLARFLHCSPSNLIFVTNATVAINIVARNLKLGLSDQVLTSDHEYGAMDRVWRFLAGKRGFEYVVQDIPTPFRSEGKIVEALWHGVSDRTRVIFLSHITSPTALRMPVREICQRAREENILTVIDGAHAPGQIDLDLDAIGADFYAANLHKWLCAPKGSGFLFVRPDCHDLLEPLIISWGWEREIPGPSTLVDYHEWQGTRDPAAFLTVPTAIDFQKEHQWHSIREQCHQIAREFEAGVAALTGLDPLSSPPFYAQMVAARLPQLDPQALQIKLHDEFRIEIPVYLWKDTPLIRASIQGYNNKDDIVLLLEVLRKVLLGSAT